MWLSQPEHTAVAVRLKQSADEERWAQKLSNWLESHCQNTSWVEVRVRLAILWNRWRSLLVFEAPSPTFLQTYCRGRIHNVTNANDDERPCCWLAGIMLCCSNRTAFFVSQKQSQGLCANAIAFLPYDNESILCLRSYLLVFKARLYVNDEAVPWMKYICYLYRVLLTKPFFFFNPLHVSDDPCLSCSIAAWTSQWNAWACCRAPLQ